MAPLRDAIMVPDVLALSPRKEHNYYDPARELYAGLWCLFAGASAFLALRVWVKVNRTRHGLWYDDYLLIVCWVSTTTGTITSIDWNHCDSRAGFHSSSFSWALIFLSPLNTPPDTRKGVGTTACIVSSFRFKSSIMLWENGCPNILIAFTY